MAFSPLKNACLRSRTARRSDNLPRQSVKKWGHFVDFQRRIGWTVKKIDRFAEEVAMKRSLTFAEILEQKMASGDAPSTSEKAEFRSENGTGRLAAPAQDATTASQLESEFSLAFDWNSLVKAKLSAFYPQAKKGAPTLKIVPKPPPRVTSDPQWPVEKLSAAARLALDKLNIGSPTISSGTLKKAYRRLARKLHPDAGGAPSAEGFLIVQEAFEIVTRELETLAKNIKL